MCVWSELGVKPATCVVGAGCPNQTESHISILAALVLAYFLPVGRWSYLLLPQLIRLSSTNSSHHTFKETVLSKSNQMKRQDTEKGKFNETQRAAASACVHS